MKIAIVGSREYKNLRAVIEYVHQLPSDTIVISGGARGVDATAESAARACGLEVEIHPALWDVFGKSAGFKRNHTIVAIAEKVVAFWDGKSRGTQHTILIARAACKQVEIIKDST